MNKYIKNIIPAAVLALSLGATSCTGDLDVTPIDPNLTLEANQNALFSECYANFALEGNSGPGSANISADDAGTAGLVRQLFNTNELSTDEAICGWGDGGVKELVISGWGSGDTMERIYWDRLYKGIMDCNAYLAKFQDTDKTMTAEVRFLRAFQYYLLMDAFGNVPLSEEITHTKTSKQLTRKEMFEWLETELKDNILPNLSAAKAVRTSSETGYGRVNQAAAWLLLARLYLNAEVYTGTARWQDAMTYAGYVINNSDYALYTTPTNGTDGNVKWTAYQKLFMGDNGESGAAVEAIFPILQQGDKTTGYGCSQFMIASTFNGNMHPDKDDQSVTNGLSGAQWGGNRARKALVKAFFDGEDDAVYAKTKDKAPWELQAMAGDNRALFWSKDCKLVASNRTDFTSGYGVTKFVNIKSDGSAGTNSSFADMDYFIMRYPEALLTYAEAEARLEGGLAAGSKGADYLNQIRARAGVSPKAGYTVNDILGEWQREFYFEGYRRPCLIRFGKFGGDTGYQWEWKNNSEEGGNFASFRNIFAIPNTESPSFYKQNPGY